MAIDWDRWLLPVRAVQLLFALIVLGVDASLIHSYTYRGYIGIGYRSFSFSQLNFLLFVAIWTLLCTSYLAATALLRPDTTLTHPFLVFGLEAVSWLFWLAGWAAVAALLDAGWCWGSACGRMSADVAFGVLEWVLFSATAGIAGWKAWTFYREGSAGKGPSTKITTAPAPQEPIV